MMENVLAVGGPSSSSSSSSHKKHKKVYIPVDKYPDINFMGLLIALAARTRSAWEDESGARILIRGKGSSKDPSGEPDGEEELHVLIHCRVGRGHREGAKRG
ncbi:hypothetical protein PINS_up015316 [Pythium insidiosum]|nr:hypothetical protein PINS_up015316 [Pythium insidiosum]